MQRNCAFCWRCFCKDEAESHVRMAEDGNGLQTWQALLRAKTLRNPMSVMNQLLDPHFIASVEKECKRVRREKLE